MLHFLVGEEEAGERLDRALAALAGVSRAQAQRWIDAGQVTRNALPARASQKVLLGDRLTATPPEVLATELVAQEIPLDVLYEDQDLLVLNKPAGLVVHPAPGHTTGTLVNALMFYCKDLAGVGGELRPGIVHRLDKGTSGVLVVAKNDAAHLALSEQFHNHTIERVYRSVVRAVPKANAGRIARPIGRHPRDRKRMSVVTKRGKSAVTHWRVEKRWPLAGLSLLEVRLETGRTHQIRVHLSAEGMPLVGDEVYGRSGRTRLKLAAAKALNRPALHAAVLGFTHPRSAERLRFESPLPPDLETLVADAENMG